MMSGQATKDAALLLHCYEQLSALAEDPKRIKAVAKLNGKGNVIFATRLSNFLDKVVQLSFELAAAEQPAAGHSQHNLSTYDQLRMTLQRALEAHQRR
jgi:hypothetical protein